MHPEPVQQPVDMGHVQKQRDADVVTEVILTELEQRQNILLCFIHTGYELTETGEAQAWKR